MDKGYEKLRKHWISAPLINPQHDNSNETFTFYHDGFSSTPQENAPIPYYDHGVDKNATVLPSISSSVNTNSDSNFPQNPSWETNKKVRNRYFDFKRDKKKRKLAHSILHTNDVQEGGDESDFKKIKSQNFPSLLTPSLIPKDTGDGSKIKSFKDLFKINNFEENNDGESYSNEVGQRVANGRFGVEEEVFFKNPVGNNQCMMENERTEKMKFLPYNFPVEKSDGDDVEYMIPNHYHSPSLKKIRKKRKKKRVGPKNKKKDRKISKISDKKKKKYPDTFSFTSIALTRKRRSKQQKKPKLISEMSLDDDNTSSDEEIAKKRENHSTFSELRKLKPKYKKKFWSKEEIQNLKRGMEIHGDCWDKILSAYSFQKRTIRSLQAKAEKLFPLLLEKIKTEKREGHNGTMISSRKPHWTKREEEYLRQGIQKYGKNWGLILEKYDFHNRTVRSLQAKAKRF